MGIFDEYCEYTEKYKKIYGNRTVVLMEVGSFFELYGVDNETETLGASMREVCGLLNIMVTRKNKNISENSRDNPMMAGIPSGAFNKYIPVLLHNNYHVVIVEQKTPPPNVTREVTEILSPSTYVDEDAGSSYETRSLIVVYLEEISDWKVKTKRRYGIGMSVVDLTTSRTFVSETYVDVGALNEELARICTCHSPKEMVLVSNHDIPDAYVPRNVHCLNMMGQLDKRFQCMSYREEVLLKTFKNKGNMLSVIEYLNLERTEMALISFVYMLDFVYNHNEKLLKNIGVPVKDRDENTLLLANNSMVQLDIVDKPDCLCDILNTCVTNIGKRHFRSTIAHPITSEDDLNDMYDDIDRYMVDDMYTKVRARLSHVHDIERLVHRKVMNPCNFVQLYTTFQEMTKIGDVDAVERGRIQAIELERCIADIDGTLDVGKAARYMLTAIYENIFEVGYDETLDGYQERMDEILEGLRDIHNTLNPALVKMEATDKEGVVFITTEKRYVDVVAAAAARGDAGSILKGRRTAANVRISTREADALNKEYIALRETIRREVAEAFTQYFDDFVVKHRERLVQAIAYIERTDYLCANAYNAAKHRFVRPSITKSEESYVRCEALRHPIIEYLQHNVKYVPNDVTLDADTRGMILYGINAAGKSSLMKSVGIAVIMAQSGMFVAANRFDFQPYDSVFTRILNADNLYKRQSTFTAEMSELRTILQCATPRSLVIGDELCSGTESVSAVALVTAGITHLAQRDISFIFATHLHELCKMEEIKRLDTVSIKHLSVNYEEASNRLVYDRRLKDGPGDTMYGLEVCRSLDLDKDFMYTANEVRKRLLGKGQHIVSNSPSRYNSMKYKDVCSVCNENIAEDMHHIEYQHTADDKGFINHYHKNRCFNLVALCTKCHHDVHQNKTKIEGYIDTSEGVVLNIKK